MEQENVEYAEEEMPNVCEYCGKLKREFETQTVLRGKNASNEQKEEYPKEEVKEEANTLEMEAPKEEEGKQVLRGPDGKPLLTEILTGQNYYQDYNQYYSQQGYGEEQQQIAPESQDNTGYQEEYYDPNLYPQEQNTQEVNQVQQQEQYTQQETQNYIPPQEIPPQEIPPQEIPPQEIPPQEIPPQEIPPMQIPPQEIPPMQMPPQEIPPMQIPTTEIPKQQPQTQFIPKTIPSMKTTTTTKMVMPVKPPVPSQMMKPQPMKYPMRPKFPPKIIGKSAVPVGPIKGFVPVPPKGFVPPPKVIPPMTTILPPKVIPPMAAKVVVPAEQTKKMFMGGHRLRARKEETNLCEECQCEENEILCPDCQKESNLNEKEEGLEKKQEDVDMDNYKYHEIRCTTEKSKKTTYVVKRQGVVIAQDSEEK